MNFFKNFNKRTWLLTFIASLPIVLFGIWNGRNSHFKELNHLLATLVFVIGVVGYPVWYLAMYGFKNIVNIIVEWNRKGVDHITLHSIDVKKEEDWFDEK